MKNLIFYLVIASFCLLLVQSSFSASSSAVSDNRTFSSYEFTTVVADINQTETARTMSSSAVWEPQNVEIVPQNPTSSDVVQITFSGWWHNSCTPVVSSVSVVDNDIYFDVTARIATCLQVVRYWERTESVGPLPEGAYTIYARMVDVPYIPEIYTQVAVFMVADDAGTGKTYYVDPNGTGDYPTIQAAIDDSNNGDTVIVADGTYTGDGNRDIDFSGKSITVRSENGPNDCIIDCNATESDRHRGFYFHSGEDANSVLDGFTIKNGYIVTCGREGGAGICIQESSPTIINCVVTNNHTELTLGCLGVCHGGGIYIGYRSNSLIISCIFANNTVRGGIGAGIYCGRGTNATIKNCIISNNGAVEYCGGGGVYCMSANGSTVLNCTFTGNLSDWGGAIWCHGVDAMIIKNCVFSENSALDPFQGGGAVNLSYSNASIINCTFNRNSTSAKGRTILCEHSNVNLDNSIIWADSTVDGNEIVLEWSSILDVNYCNIKGGQSAIYNNLDRPSTINWGPGNIDIDPCFADPDVNDYHLLLDSPCINTGDPNYVPEPNETDLDGLPRVIGGRIDMGAYEFNNQPVAVAGPNQTAYAFINGLADVTLDGSTSYDEEDDPLDYYWSWFVDSNLCEANGISPTIQLPVGEHQIELIVDDGFDDSEPNYCTVTIIEPLKTWLWLWPNTINCNSRPQNVTTFVYLPKGIEPGDVSDEPLTMYPCDMQSKYQRVFRMGRGRYAQTVVMAVFDKDEICDYFGTGWHKVEVAGQLHSGRYFYGANIIKITRPWRRHWPFHRNP